MADVRDYTQREGPRLFSGEGLYFHRNFEKNEKTNKIEEKFGKNLKIEKNAKSFELFHTQKIQ